MYATVTSILTLLPGLPQSAGAEGYTKISNRISQHITRAEAIINAAIAERYDTSASPFNTATSIPPFVRMICEDMASYYTYRSEFSKDGRNLNDWTDKFKEAQELLFMIRDQEMVLTDTNGSMIDPRENTDSDEISSNTEDYTPAFGEDSTTSWVVDEDKLTDYSDSR